METGGYSTFSRFYHEMIAIWSVFDETYAKLDDKSSRIRFSRSRRPETPTNQLFAQKTVVVNKLILPQKQNRDSPPLKACYFWSEVLRQFRLRLGVLRECSSCLEPMFLQCFDVSLFAFVFLVLFYKARGTTLADF